MIYIMHHVKPKIVRFSSETQAVLYADAYFRAGDRHIKLKDAAGSPSGKPTSMPWRSWHKFLSSSPPSTFGTPPSGVGWTMNRQGGGCLGVSPPVAV